MIEDFSVAISSHRLLPMADGGDSDYHPDRWLWSDELIAVHDRGATILTGIWSGTVKVSAETSPTPLPLDLGDWEDVSEATVNSDTGRLTIIGGLGYPDSSAAELTPKGAPGPQRVRVHAKGRAENYDDAGIYQSREEYHIQIWPLSDTDTDTDTDTETGRGVTHRAESGR